MAVYATLSVKGEKKVCTLNYIGQLKKKKHTKGKLFNSLCIICFRNMATMQEKALDVIYTANSCRHVPSPIKKVNATMAVRNMQVKTQSGRNKAPHTTQISAALNNIPPVSMSNSLACFHYKTKVTFVCVSNVL